MTLSLKPLLESWLEPIKRFFGQPPAETPEKTVRFSVLEDGIGQLTFDRPGSSANIFDLRALADLAEELEFISHQMTLKGLVFTSAKPAIFIAGADLNLLRAAASSADVRQVIERGQAVMNAIASLSIPTVAAIHGAAVGGGYELCLACDYRVAAPGRSTKIGLPETNLGLLPGWGGSTRLPRLIGLPKALEVILAGKTVSAEHALKFGMVDEVAPVEHLMEAATRMIRAGKPMRSQHRFTNNRFVAKLIEHRVRRDVVRKTRGHYPAMIAALEVAARGVARSVEDSLALERDAFPALVQTEASRNLLRLFFLQERAKKRTWPGTGAGTKAGKNPKPVRHTAVIGAGVMGAGIAQWLSARERSVILRDVNTEAVHKGMTSIAGLYRDGLKRRVFTSLEMRDGLDRVCPAPMEVPLRRVDLVIEAAVESMELKKAIFRHVDELAGDETILATNTSALSISEIAEATRHPERVIGLHFFNPVHRMQLVEVVVAPRTAPEVVQRTLRFAQQIGKLPVVVRDSPGFLVNRILMPYLIEAAMLFETGARLEDLDAVMLDFGMPMGPLRLVDEVGLDVALKVAAALAKKFPAGLQIPGCLQKLTDAGLLGRKSGRGFYRYEKGKEAGPNPQALEFVREQKARVLPRLELQERMIFLMANEAARCLEEGVVTEPADVDFAMVMGTGFAPFHGGPLRHVDAIGATKLAGAMGMLVAQGAAHFTPCKLLGEMAVTGRRFYEND